jgi:hypothetical protein
MSNGRRDPVVDLATVVRHSGPIHKAPRHKKRYVVFPVAGWLIDPASDVRTTNAKRAPTTWAVLDSAYCYREIDLFVNRGHRDAEAKARALCDELNREDAA